MSTCELCDMRPALKEIMAAMAKLEKDNSFMPSDIYNHLEVAYNRLEDADWALENHELDCTAPMWDGPDTVEEARL